MPIYHPTTNALLKMFLLLHPTPIPTNTPTPAVQAVPSDKWRQSQSLHSGAIFHCPMPRTLRAGPKGPLTSTKSLCMSVIRVPLRSLFRSPLRVAILYMTLFGSSNKGVHKFLSDYHSGTIIMSLLRAPLRPGLCPCSGHH